MLFFFLYFIQFKKPLFKHPKYYLFVYFNSFFKVKGDNVKWMDLDTRENYFKPNFQLVIHHKQRHETVYLFY